nr:hypothetical protein [Candidatus Sigynarchaeum springense]
METGGLNGRTSLSVPPHVLSQTRAVAEPLATNDLVSAITTIANIKAIDAIRAVLARTMSILQLGTHCFRL